MSRHGLMHDVLFAHDFPPMGGGIARWMAALAAGYPVGELIVSTGAIDGSAAADLAQPQVVERIAVRVDRLKTLPGLRAWSREAVRLGRDPAARFAWCDTIRPAGYTAYWAFRRTGLPYGIMVVGNDVLTLRAKIARSPFKRPVMRAVLGNAAAFVAISQWTATQCRQLLNELGLESAAARVRVVPLGTDPVRWRRDAAGATAFQSRFRLPDGRYLVTVARLVEYKGIDTVIRLMAELGPSRPALHYVVIGRGPDEARLRSLAEGLGIGDRVHLLTAVSDEELAAGYSLGDVYVGLTRETPLDVEGFGISFAEAAACGLPVVATRTGGIPDAVVDGETGILVEQHDIAGAKAALQLLLGDAAKARQMGLVGRRRVENYLNWDRVVREMRGVAEEFGRQR